MEPKKITEFTDEELLQEAKNMKYRSIINALIIGFMIGVVIYSILKNTVGLFILIPLFFIYKMVNNSKNDKALKDQLKKRNLK